MRHLFVATAFVLVALLITFGTASVLQSVATARKVPAISPDPTAVAEPVKATPVKAKQSEQARQAILAARRAG